MTERWQRIVAEARGAFHGAGRFPSGYHDTLDTLANIDLDDCAALPAIAIETVASCACELP